MSMFHVGQRVVCITDVYSVPAAKNLLDNGYKFPTKGMRYTIRHICKINGSVCLLEEIVNHPLPWKSEEPGFGLSHFRPVKDTSIEVFRALLAPIHERENA
ncbi:hypothetical protein EZH22_24535 [Xanthobacter dioxanivorans]|uniref:Uncharacterized protein n=1 Tax=Xanthobacter dioxanivorans TaxID=2528964 RepID=A0A974PMV0_9HYPH|nr:hypothetical protein [Xanthobacter dioxanivorans]QRG06121.1 hypothetical protein EZH22_24535 [Xanthobacter dioxanivorans]